MEQSYSARSERDGEIRRGILHANFEPIAAPSDIFDRALQLQRELAHLQELWHRIPIPDLHIAETALHHNHGMVRVDGNFARIAGLRPLVLRRLGYCRQ